ncbi:ubiquitin-protein ligase [Rhynchospora pubera]|uniref:Ubiquitin-protein ligase n=1 Tax=Rhynchospora pubera TaxID=906938 RepID=A0AAV8GW05_9POAL|nr:ubiquitin-protein ligase [Rhynchospora pubera]
MGVTRMDALRELALVDLIELCNEARIEHCRATRDLSSCGRPVQHLLSTCGHASLCPECSQRCETCPVCRVPIKGESNRARLRLYYKCIEAGLISKQHDDRFQAKEGIGNRANLDVERLYLLFDVALQNNLSSLICHYVTDVCLDENAVSSDPVLAFLLDEVVVKDWCKRSFTHLLKELQTIYKGSVENMQKDLPQMQKYVTQLNGVCIVIEAMVSSFDDSVHAQVHDLHQLLEHLTKAKQHLEVMIWCTRHKFLEHVQPQYSDIASWELDVNERKASLARRSWPQINLSAMTETNPSTSLFIEEALQNLDLEDDHEEDILLSLEHERPERAFYPQVNWSNQYPFKSVRAAADVLFLHGASDTVVAKQAIFLYYLIDRHGMRPDSDWRFLLDDFCAAFGVTSQALTECMVFYLLDNHSDQALEEAILLLPKIANPETHPKIAQVLLERQRPDAALTLLRCTGSDDLPASAETATGATSLKEAVNAVRVRIEYGLLTEAFIYQRSYCAKVKDSDVKLQQVELIVSEMCALCVERGLADRMIELPWNHQEEKYLHKCLLDKASEKPESTSGSLLVVFYLQRYRYAEAYKVHTSLNSTEQEAIEKLGTDASSKIRKRSQWRHDLVARSLELLPESERHKVILECSSAEEQNDVAVVSRVTNLPNQSVVRGVLYA